MHKEREERRTRSVSYCSRPTYFLFAFRSPEASFQSLKHDTIQFWKTSLYERMSCSCIASNKHFNNARLQPNIFFQNGPTVLMIAGSINLASAHAQNIASGI